MSSQQESPALTVARAHVDAWAGKDWDAARSLLAPDVKVVAMTTAPYPPPTDLTGADDYKKGLASVADEHNALLALDLRVAGGPFGDGVPAPCARLYRVENGKIKAEQVVFYVSQG